MKWNQFRLKTTTEAEDIVSSMLADLGIEGVQIEDKIPLTQSDKEQMFVDILPDMPEDDGCAYLTFYLDEEVDKHEMLLKVRQELEEMRSYLNVGDCTIEESQTEDVDWVNNWKQYFHQFYIDDILVIPSWEDVEAKIWTDVTDDWARLMEVDDNLAGAEMNALDTAVFLAERKRLYEKLHPETVAATGAALVAKRWGDTSDTMSFVSATAEKFGLSKRQIERIVAAGTALNRDDVRHLRAAKAPVTLKDLTEISRIPEDHERAMVVLKLSGGSAKSAAEARKQLEAEEGRAPVIDPMKKSEDEFRALAGAWKRAGAAARRRFITEVIEREGGAE